MKCTDCRYHVSQDTGYSNYTVEGTDIDCLLSLNKDFPTDQWYKEEESLLFAIKCPRFVNGDGVYFDVDGETTAEDYKDDEEIYLLLTGGQQ